MADTTYTITADDLAALRLAETVSFHYYKGEGSIRASLRGDTCGDGPRIFTAREQRLFPDTRDTSDRKREVATDTSITGYGYRENGGREWGRENAPNAHAFEMIHSAQYDNVWMTVVRLLRVGDALTLVWVADNNTGYVREAHLHRDQLSIRVDRATGAPLEFLIDVSVCPDNSARMIKRNGF